MSENVSELVYSVLSDVVYNTFPSYTLIPLDVLCALILGSVLLLGLLLYVFRQSVLLYPDVLGFFATKVLVHFVCIICAGYTVTPLGEHIQRMVNWMRSILPSLCGNIIKRLYLGSTQTPKPTPKKTRRKSRTPPKHNAPKHNVSKLWSDLDLLTLYHDIGVVCQSRNIVRAVVLYFIYLGLTGMDTQWQCTMVGCIVVVSIVKYYKTRTPSPEKNSSQQHPTSNSDYDYWIFNIPVFLVVIFLSMGTDIALVFDRLDILSKSWTDDNLEAFVVVLARILSTFQMTTHLLTWRDPRRVVYRWLRPSYESNT